MASGSIGSGWTSLQNPVSLGCSMGTNEYPSGTITFNGISPGNCWWYNGGNNQTMTVYLCDSSGGNSYKLFDVTWNSEMTNTTTKTATGMNCTGLKGKALYIKATFTSQSAQYAYHRGNTSDSVSIGTAIDQVYLTVNSSNTNMGTVSGSGNHTPGVAVNISASAKNGYHFTGWTCTSGSGSFGNASAASTTFTTSGAATVVASFAANTYTVTVNGSANTWAYGSQHTISASAQTGKTFSSWTLSGAGSIASASSSSTTFTVGAGNATLTANYSWVYYTVSKAVNPSGTGTVTTGKSSAHYGEEVTVSASPSTGYQLSSWSTNVSGVSVNNGKFTMPASNITVTGNFSKVSYAITMRANPEGGGNPSASKSTANYGDTITLTPNRASGYLFDGWTSSDVTVSGNTFTMPAKAVTVTGNYHIGRSTASVDKTTVTPGDTLALTITAEQATFYHTYKLSFGLGMETDWVTVAAGTSSAEIYIPLAWSRMMKSNQKTGGTLTVKTYEGDNTYLGEYVIDSLTYNALNNTIPKLQIRRADDADTPNIKGTKAKYTITVPSDVDSYTLSCNEAEAENPPKSGLILPENAMTFATDTSVIVELEIVFGSETFTLTESVPSVWLLEKSVG